jgi:membrane protein implicated in regulation of membrane protease activity
MKSLGEIILGLAFLFVILVSAIFINLIVAIILQVVGAIVFTGLVIYVVYRVLSRE